MSSKTKDTPAQDSSQESKVTSTTTLVASAVAALESASADASKSTTDVGSLAKKASSPQPSPTKKQNGSKSPRKSGSTAPLPTPVESPAKTSTGEGAAAASQPAAASTEPSTSAEATKDDVTDSTASKDDSTPAGEDGKPQRERSNSRYRNYAPRGGLVSPPFKRNFSLEEGTVKLSINDGEASVSISEAPKVEPTKKAERDRDRPGYFKARKVRRDSVKNKDPAIIESKKATEQPDIESGTAAPVSASKQKRRRNRRKNNGGNNGPNVNQRDRSNTQDHDDEYAPPPPYRGRSYSNYSGYVQNYGGGYRNGGFHANRYSGPPSPGYYGQYPRPYFYGPQGYHNMPYYGPRNYDHGYVNYPPRQYYGPKNGPMNGQQPQNQRGNGPRGGNGGSNRGYRQQRGHQRTDTERSEPVAKSRNNSRSRSIEVTVES